MLPAAEIGPQARAGRLGWEGQRVPRRPLLPVLRMSQRKQRQKKDPRAIRQLRARQRKRVAAIRKLSDRYAEQPFPKRKAEKWNRLNRELDETEELITDLRARYERTARLDEVEE
jgi:hypothetical protein